MFGVWYFLSCFVCLQIELGPRRAVEGNKIGEDPGDEEKTLEPTVK